MRPWYCFSKFLETVKKNSIKLNYEKIQYKQKEVEFLDEMYTTIGCEPSNAKIKAITKMPKPALLKDPQTLLGMVQYLSKFSPRNAELAEPRCDLMKKYAPYVWGPEHSQALYGIKKEIVQAPILKYYDPKKVTILQTDASSKGSKNSPLLICDSLHSGNWPKTTRNNPSQEFNRSNAMITMTSHLYFPI